MLLAIQALFKLRQLDSDSAAYISRTIDFALKVPTFEMSGTVKNVVTEECSKLLNGKPVTDLVMELAAKARSDPFTSLPTRVVVAESLVITKTEPVATSASLIVDGGMHMREFNIESCRKALAALKGFGSEASTFVEQWILFVKERYPLVKNFS